VEQPVIADATNMPPSAVLASPATLPPSPTPDPTATPTPDPTPQPVASVLAVVAPPQAATPPSLYRIEIARLGINLPIAEGDVPRDVERAQTPNFYAFHLPGTSMFGAGNTYIYSHARVGMFLALWNVELGDVVIVRTPSGPREYVVAEIHPRVPPTEISWTRPTPDTRLTLQTSTGPYGTDPRFVVVARPR
jgi:sortase (surface protein transpeptidase)